MAVKPIPTGFHTVTPYLVVEGIEKLIGFLKDAFGAKASEVMKRPDGSIMHAQVRIGNSYIMLGEPMPGHPARPTNLYLYVKDTDALYQRALKAGGTSLMEPADQFYGDRNAGVEDASGNQWWIGTHIEDVAPDEMARRAEAAMKRRQGA